MAGDKSRTKRDDVGPGRPPKDKQFQKGNPGGPGRPPGVSITAIAKRMLAEASPETRKQIAENIAAQWLAKAAEGSPKHLEILLDRTEGKVTQPIEVEGNMTMGFGPQAEKYQ